MKRIASTILWTCLGLAVPGAAQPVVAQESGTLVFDLKNYTADTKIPERNQKVLEHGGVQWGIVGDTVVITLVGRNFVKADIPYLARFGEQKTLQMKPGQYKITCIGLTFGSTSRDVDKSLSKSAFFNNDVLTFAVLPGKTTTLEVLPVYEAESHWRGLTKIKMYIPDLKVRVLEDGTQKGEEVEINKRTVKSIAWDDYHGPLKF